MSNQLHLVHWNSDYGNMSYAMDQKDGLLVITVFIETKIITDFGVIQVNKDNQAITPIINILGNIRLFSQSARIETPLDLESLVPKEMELFYKYEGSLTTPPCSPCATFIIFVAPIYMSVQQVIYPPINAIEPYLSLRSCRSSDKSQESLSMASLRI